MDGKFREVYIGKPMNHIEKYLLINRMFAGQATLIPMFNEQNNEDLVNLCTNGRCV